MRRSLVVVAALVLAGAASAAPGDPQKQIKAANQAYARALVVRASELPDGRWRASPTDFSQTNPPCIVRRYSLEASTLNGEAGTTYAQGAGLTSGGILVESDGDVFETAAQAKKAFGLLVSTGLARCLATSLVAGAKASGTAARLAGLATIRPSIAGTGARNVQPGGWQFLLRLSRAGATRMLEVTQVALLRGRALASIGVVRTHSAQPWAPLASLEAAAASRMTKP